MVSDTSCTQNKKKYGFKGVPKCIKKYIDKNKNQMGSTSDARKAIAWNLFPES